MAQALACLRVTLPSWPAAAARLLQNCWARVEKALPSDLSAGFPGPSWVPPWQEVHPERTKGAFGGPRSVGSVLGARDVADVPPSAGCSVPRRPRLGLCPPLPAQPPPTDNPVPTVVPGEGSRRSRLSPCSVSSGPLGPLAEFQTRPPAAVGGLLPQLELCPGADASRVTPRREGLGRRRALNHPVLGFPGPALAGQGPAAPDASGVADGLVWMAAPKNRRTVEVNRCRRRNPQKMVKVKNNIDVCPECGHLKQKHVLCGYCYKKVREETAQIRRQIGKQEGGLLRLPPLRLWYYTKKKLPRQKIKARELLSETGSDRPGSPGIDAANVVKEDHSFDIKT